MDIEKIVLVILGAIVGFIVSIMKDFLLENKKKKLKQEEIRRDKLEELYIIVGNWSTALLGNSLTFLAVLNARIEYPKYSELTANMTTSKYDFNRLEMILNIYAINLKPLYKEVLEARSKINTIQGKYINQYRHGDSNGKHFVNEYTDAQNNFENLTKLLKQEIANLVVS